MRFRYTYRFGQRQLSQGGGHRALALSGEKTALPQRGRALELILRRESVHRRPPIGKPELSGDDFTQRCRLKTTPTTPAAPCFFLFLRFAKRKIHGALASGLSLRSSRSLRRHARPPITLCVFGDLTTAGVVGFFEPDSLRRGTFSPTLLSRASEAVAPSAHYFIFYTKCSSATECVLWTHVTHATPSLKRKR